MVPDLPLSLQAAHPQEAHLPLQLQALPPLNLSTLATLDQELWLLELEHSTVLDLANVHVSAVKHHSPTLLFKVLTVSVVFQVSYTVPV
jgi:hypothetical protein